VAQRFVALALWPERGWRNDLWLHLILKTNKTNLSCGKRITFNVWHNDMIAILKHNCERYNNSHAGRLIRSRAGSNGRANHLGCCGFA
jgi:hypothetical protein